MQINIETIEQLRLYKGITKDDINKVSTYQNYYNLKKKKWRPSLTTEKIFMDLFEIDQETFDKLTK